MTLVVFHPSPPVINVAPSSSTCIGSKPLLPCTLSLPGPRGAVRRAVRDLGAPRGAVLGASDPNSFGEVVAGASTGETKHAWTKPNWKDI